MKRDDNSVCWLSTYSEHVYVKKKETHISQKPIENNPTSADNCDEFRQKLDYDDTEFGNSLIYQIPFQY